jgi:anti-anti-sigma factor
MSAQLFLHEQLDGGLVSLRPAGELGAGTAALLEEAVKRLCDEQRQGVLLDLGRVTFIDTAGVRTVLKCRQLFAEHDCRLWMVGLDAPIRRVMKGYEWVGERPLWELPNALAPAQQPLRH